MELFGTFVIVAFILMAMDIVDFDLVCSVGFFLLIFGVFDGDDKKEVRLTKTEVNVTLQEQQEQAVKYSEDEARSIDRETRKEKESIEYIEEPEHEVDNTPVRDWTW